ncbi:linear amide C-N hydrolase [Maridesulfovibrio frigidus]|uniref:linear amide C-N hydrolase n=1 Tax=Maridesulfovibrio frigidus TaxID=340956 RepID=UPI0005524639|nr:choloylglycine hydrolase family protein [Maridesulfovibrio frigidus]
MNLILSFVSICALAIMGSFMAVFPAQACTGITLEAKNKDVVYARTLEWAESLESKVITIPRGMAYKSTPPKNVKGINWKSKYGVVGSNVFGQPIVLDGMNEKGLHVGLFFLPEYTEYQKSKSGVPALASWEVPVWLLTSFATVDEAVAALKTVQVWGAPLAGTDADPTYHFSITDSSGGSVVVEYVKGELNIHENMLGVITNSPTFDWHQTNLSNYVNLSATNVHPLDVKSKSIAPFGQGSGMHGLPGDITPPSRFVRAAVYTSSVLPSENGAAAVKQAVRIMNAFYIVEGFSKEVQNGKTLYDHTLWTTVSDLANKVYYFCDYEGLSWLSVDMKNVDFTGKKVKSISMTGEFAKDVSKNLK